MLGFGVSRTRSAFLYSVEKLLSKSPTDNDEVTGLVAINDDSLVEV